MVTTSVPTAQKSRLRSAGGVAEVVAPIVYTLLGDPPPLRIELWDGSGLGPAHNAGTLYCTPDAVRRLLWSPNELGLARAYVAGDLDADGDIFEVVALATLPRGPSVGRSDAPGGRACRPPARRPRAAAAAAAGGGPAPRRAALHAARRRRDRPPLRRRQRLLPARARPVDDVLVRRASPRARPTSPTRRPRSTT